MRPHLGLAAQAFHRAIEHLDHQLRRDHLVLDFAHGDQVNLRLLDLNHRTAGVGKLVVFLVEGVGDGEHALGHALVVAVLQRKRHDLRRYGAEFDRPFGEPLRRFPHRGVLQIAAPDLAGDDGHDARLEIVVQNMTARKADAASSRGRRLGMRGVQPAHVVRRIGSPALAADVVVESAVAVGDDVEAGEFLIAQIAGERILVLLAKAAAHHRLEKMPGAEILRVPARPRQ